MYTYFYGLSKKPFNVTPDPDFLYMSKNHQETLASIIYGINERKGFITIIGEVGTGKTTLLNATLRSLDKKTQAAFIFNTDLTFEELLQMVLMDLGLASEEETLPKFVALDRLNRHATELFSAGGNIVIIIDEAQNLDFRTMENLRLLSNLETSKYKLVQIVLSGQPELDEKLRRKELRQLAQRINLKRYILPLSKEDTYGYIDHQLRVGGFDGRNFFSQSSLKLIWEYSGGIPRKINMLCDNALLIGYGLGKEKISNAEIREAIKDLSWTPYATHNSEKARRNDFEQHAPWTLRFAGGFVVLLIGFFLGAAILGFWFSKSDESEKISAVTEQYWMALSNVWESRVSEFLKNKSDRPPVPISKSNGESLSVPKDPISSERMAPIGKDINEKSAMEPSVEGLPSMKAEKNDMSVDNVIVEEGDHLVGIVEEAYGKNDRAFQFVLDANPQIEDPNVIIPGQIIHLPKVSVTGNLLQNRADYSDKRPENQDNDIKQ